MYLLNLTFLQFAAVFGGVTAVAVALYLLDRSRRQQVVSTLRFWVVAEQPPEVARRRHIQQPWSLVLQLASMALLLLAVAELRWGTPAGAGRDHVLILDTSAWMAARTGNRTLMQVAQDRARRYLRALPADDRVMLVRADALATPATAFELDRRKVDNAILASEPGYTALNLDQALEFARHIQLQTGRRAGEIAFAGTGRTAGRDPGAAAAPRNLRVLPVADNAIENCGLRKIGMRRSSTDASVWDVYISAHNYGTAAREVGISLEFTPAGTPAGPAGRIPVGTRRVELAAGADGEATVEFRSRAAGVLRVSLSPGDAFPADDRAELDVPAQPVLPVVVYSSQPELLRPLLSSNPRVEATYRKPEEYKPANRGLVILDRFIPPSRPAGDSLWIEPPAMGSPIAVRQTAEQVPFARWAEGSPIAAGLHTKDFKLDRTEVFEAGADDQAIALVEAGPVMVARNRSPRVIALGFHPALSPLRYELAGPLLFANILRWAAPEVFRKWEITGGSVGTVRAELDEGVAANDVKVTSQDGTALPFTVRGRVLHFFSGLPGSVRARVGEDEYVFSLTLPEPWETRWEPPESVRRGVPKARVATGTAPQLWPWLALAGGLGLLAEWFLFGRALGRPRHFLGHLGLSLRRRIRQPAGVRR